MENVIHKEVITKYLKKGGNIIDLISRADQREMNQLVMANKTNWEKIFDLPEFVYHSFDMRMRRACDVSEIRFPSTAAPGPHIEFSKKADILSIRIDSEDIPRGIIHYRRCLTVVAYYVGVLGHVIDPVDEGGELIFTDEDWIILSMATRFSLMPPKYIQKILLLTQMHFHNAQDSENDQTTNGKSFISNFISNLSFQTRLPDWVIRTRLHEHSFADSAFSQVIRRRSVDELIEEYRTNEYYTAPVV